MSERTIRINREREYIAPAELVVARPPPRRIAIPTWIWATLLTSSISLGVFSFSWSYEMGNRVTALEQRATDRAITEQQFEVDVQQRLSDIQMQVSEINTRLDNGR